MSIVKNEPICKIGIIRRVRELLEHRALWLYLCVNEAEKKGMKYEDFSGAIKSCGLSQGKDLAKGDNKKSFKTLQKRLFSWSARKVFDMKIVECTDEKLSIDFHYCPLVKAWQKAGCSDEQIAKLCDVAMCGDRGIAESFGGVLDLEQVIAKGAPICKIRFHK